jgi:hypothetical protein
MNWRQHRLSKHGFQNGAAPLEARRKVLLARIGTLFTINYNPSNA